MSDDKGISLEEFYAIPEDNRDGISIEEFEKIPESYSEQAKKMAAGFMTGVGKGVPFGQDIPAALGATLSELGLMKGSRAIPEEGTWSEKFAAAKKAQERAYEAMGEQAPVSRGLGTVTGVAGSVPMFEVAAPAEAMFASKAVPAVESVLGRGAGTEALVDAASQGLKGAWQSGVTGLGEGDTMEERLANAKSAAGWGAAIGVGLPFLPKAVGISRLSEEERLARDLGAPMPASVGSHHMISRPVSEALNVSPLTKSIMSQGVTKGKEELGEALIEKGDFVPGLSHAQAGTGAKASISNWIDTTFKDEMEKLYRPVSHSITRTGGATKISPLTDTIYAYNDIMRRRQNAGLDTIASKPLSLIENAVSRGGLTYQGVQDLKGKIGELKDELIATSGMDKTEAERLYASLTADVERAAEMAGGRPAADAYKQATKEANKLYKKRDRLAQIIGQKGQFQDSKVFENLANYAKAKGGNEPLLKEAKSIMPQAAWRDVSSRVAQSLGEKEGGFNTAQFVKRYSELSPEGKDLLFGPASSPSRKVLDDIHKISKRYVDVGREAHYSKLSLAALSGIAGATAGAIAGGITSPVATAIAGVGTVPLAFFMSQPRLGHLFARFMENPQNKNLLKNFQDAVRLYATRQFAPVQERREERAAGGKVKSRDYPAKRLTRLERAAKRAQNEIALETKPILNQPDQLVAKALQIAREV